jgi:hypothetical protein
MHCKWCRYYRPYTERSERKLGTCVRIVDQITPLTRKTKPFPRASIDYGTGSLLVHRKFGCVEFVHKIAPLSPE